jgi:hypothetical protein
VDQSEHRPAVAVPKKLSESWFSVFDGTRHVGYDWIYWEPHADKTAWLAREARFVVGGHTVDRKVEARFRLESRPVLAWCRARDGEETSEYALTTAQRPGGRSPVHTLRPEDGLLPSALVAVIASAAKDTPGELSTLAVLHEWSGEAALAQRLVGDGPDDVESPDLGKLPATRIRLCDGPGDAVETFWIDRNRRLRRFAQGGLIAVLTSKVAATATPGA